TVNSSATRRLVVATRTPRRLPASASRLPGASDQCITMPSSLSPVASTGQVQTETCARWRKITRSSDDRRRGSGHVHHDGVEGAAVALLHGGDEAIGVRRVERDASRDLAGRLRGAAEVRQLLRVGAVRVHRPELERAVPGADAAGDDDATA